VIRLPDWLDPWRANRELRSEIARLRWEVAGLNLALQKSNGWYDRVRAANAELRAALELYRNEGRD
jgi:hypothetical protein